MSALEVDDMSKQEMKFVQYERATFAFPDDIRRMRAVLAAGGIMAFELDIERVWKDYSSRGEPHSNRWHDLPKNDSVLLTILLAGFGIGAPAFELDDDLKIPPKWY